MIKNVPFSSESFIQIDTFSICVLLYGIVQYNVVIYVRHSVCIGSLLDSFDDVFITALSREALYSPADSVIHPFHVDDACCTASQSVVSILDE